MRFVTFQTKQSAIQTYSKNFNFHEHITRENRWRTQQNNPISIDEQCLDKLKILSASTKKEIPSRKNTDMRA